MALLHYMYPKSKEGFLEFRGPLSLSIPPHTISRANQEVQAILKQSRTRGPYKKYDTEVRAQIGKYSSLRGVVAAARFFSRKLDKQVSETRDYTLSFRWTGNAHATPLPSTHSRVCNHRYG